MPLLKKIINFIIAWWILLTLLALSPLFLAYGQILVERNNYIDHGIFQFWLAGRMILDGLNPYDSIQWINLHHQANATWIPNNIFLYPLALAYLLTPFGAMSVAHAYLAWSYLAQLTIAASILLMLDKWEIARTKLFALPLLSSIYLFYPVLQALANSTVSAFFLFILVCGIYAHEKKQNFLSGLVIGILILKPTLGFVICGLVGLWALARRNWSIISGLATTSALIYLMGLFRDIHWVSKFLAENGGHLQDTFQSQPTVFNLGLSICNSNQNCAISISAILILLFALPVIYVLIKKNARLSLQIVLTLASPLAMLLAPYIWPYEYVLLILPFIFISEKLILLTKSFIISTLFLAFVVGVSFASIANGGFQGIIVIPFGILIILGAFIWIGFNQSDAELKD